MIAKSDKYTKGEPPKEVRQTIVEKTLVYKTYCKEDKQIMSIKTE